MVANSEFEKRVCTVFAKVSLGSLPVAVFARVSIYWSLLDSRPFSLIAMARMSPVYLIKLRVGSNSFDRKHDDATATGYNSFLSRTTSVDPPNTQAIWPKWGSSACSYI